MMLLTPRHQRRLGAVIIGATLGGLAFTFWDLSRAVTRARELYAVYTLGSQIEGDLAYSAQESRRAYFDALASADPDHQISCFEQARAADRAVGAGLDQLHGLHLGESEKILLQSFRHSWNTWLSARDEMAARIRENRSAAFEHENTGEKPAFSSALARLKAFKEALGAGAKREAAALDAALRRPAYSMSALSLAGAALIIGVIASSRGRNDALRKLEASNVALMAAQHRERQRTSILEMIGAQEPLAKVLEAVCELLPKGERMGCAIWAVENGGLRLQASSGLPEDFRHRLASYVRPLHAVIEEPFLSRLELQMTISNEAARHELQWITDRRLCDPDGALIGLVEIYGAPGAGGREPAMLAEISRLSGVGIANRALYERLAFQAQHDTLTGLPNRLLFQDRLEQATRLARRTGRKAAVIWIDLDRYKHVNDTFGHATGDDVIRQIGRRLSGCVRESDTVARVGGDEFNVLLSDIAAASDAEAVALKIMRAISAPLRVAGHELAITSSCGISVFPDHGEDLLKLVRAADVAMYTAKRQGRNAVRIFQSSFDASMKRRLELEQHLKRAIQNSELHLEYQPLLNAASALDGVEALLRWTSPVLGRVSPADFIPVAEEMGIIVEIGEWVLRAACTEAAGWATPAGGLPRLAVNVSPIELARPDFAARVSRILAETGFPPSSLELEVTETALMHNLGQVVDQIEALRGTGVRFAIDDFGTGYSSLSQLRRLPVDILKIDGSFTREVGDPAASSATIIRGIIGLAHNLRLSVVAEGVESEEQLAILNSLGCDLSQGFFLHRPMPPESLRALLSGATGAKPALITAPENA
jgi:diguanylate cyclase (GGDEF)-like protein